MKNKEKGYQMRGQGQNGAPGWVKPVVVITAAVALIAVGKLVDAPALLGGIMEWIDQTGWLGIFVFIAIYIAACVFFVPGSMLTLGAGVVFGVIKGSIIVSLASTSGATAAFVIGRYLAREWISSKIEGNAKFEAIDEAIGREGWRIVGLVRLSPIFPFNLLNYAFGITRISLGQYVLASWVGMMPGTIMYVYLGSLAGSLATIGNGGSQQEKTPAQWALYVGGLLATVAVTIYITKIARAALDKISELPHEQ